MSAAKKIESFGVAHDPGELKPKIFERFAKRLYDIAGIHLPVSEKNLSLVKNRLSRILRKESIASFEELANMMDNPSPALLEQFISALTTNKTHYFREEAHFDFLKKQLETHFEKHQDLRIWCAAASTGQEPYTLALVVKESVPPQYHSKCRILATDIDLEVLQKAANGVYTESEMEGLPSYLRTRYFTTSSDKQHFRVNDDVAKLVHFSRFNLIQGNYNFRTPFHYVFCRNVLIYFDPPTTKQVISNLASTLQKDGYLILGHSESGMVSDPQIKALSQATYRKL